MSNERRKYYRTPLLLPIEVYSYACERSRFYEQTETMNVSPLGASFRLHNIVDIDDIVRLVLPMPAQMRLYDQNLATYQIYAQVRRVRPRGDGFVNVGVAFISKDPPEIEVSEPVRASEPTPEIAITPPVVDEVENSDVFATRPLGPQGLVRTSLNTPNPLANRLRPPSAPVPVVPAPPVVPAAAKIPSTPLNNLPVKPPSISASLQNSIDAQDPLTTNPNTKPSAILTSARENSSSNLKHPTIAQSMLNNDRNEPRAKLRLSLSIRGLDKSGQYFVEVIQTEDVSKHGVCFMLCKHELEPNSIVEIVGFQGKFHAQGEVKHINYNQVDKTYRIGIRLLGQPNNWIVK